jgi:hypothetical protein
MNGNIEGAKRLDIRVILMIVPYHHLRPISVPVHSLKKQIELPLQSSRTQLADNIKQPTFHEAKKPGRP